MACAEAFMAYWKQAKHSSLILISTRQYTMKDVYICMSYKNTIAQLLVYLCARTFIK